MEMGQESKVQTYTSPPIMSVSKTNTKSAKAHRVFDISTFERDLSDGEVGLSLAVDRLGRALYSGDVASLTDLLLRKVNLFEYVYSGT